MSDALSQAKDVLYDCDLVGRRLRATIQSIERINGVKKQSTFLRQHAAKTVSKPLHCLSYHLATDYLLDTYASREQVNRDKLTNLFSLPLCNIL